MTAKHVRAELEAILKSIQGSDGETVWEPNVKGDLLTLAFELSLVTRTHSGSEYWSLTDTGAAWLLIRKAALHPDYDALKEAQGVLFVPAKTRNQTPAA